MEQTQRQNQLVEGPIGRTLLGFALPFLLANFLQALYGAVDLFVVGQYTGSPAVSAVAIGSQVMMTITGIVLGIAMGGTVLIGHRIGENRPEEAGRAVGNLAFLLGVSALILTPVMLLCTPGAVALMDTPAEAVAEARAYLTICSAGIPFIIGYNAVSAVFRGAGDSRTPVVFIGLACAINVAGDFLFTGLLGWGAAGAAAATVTAQGVSFLASLLYLWRRGLSFPLRRQDLRPQREAITRILRVGSPLALQDALVNVSFLAITVIMNGLGLVASASVGVVERIIGFAMLPPAAFGSAVAAMAAQNIGAGRADRARKTLMCGIGFSLIFGVAVCVYAQFLPETLTSIFSKDAAVIAAGGQYLRLYSIDCIMVSFIFCMNGYFSGCGRTVVSFCHSMAATFGVRIPLTYFMSQRVSGSLLPMGLAAPAASLLSILICGVYFWWLRRKEKLALPA